MIQSHSLSRSVSHPKTAAALRPANGLRPVRDRRSPQKSFFQDPARAKWFATSRNDRRRLVTGGVTDEVKKWMPRERTVAAGLKIDPTTAPIQTVIPSPTSLSKAATKIWQPPNVNDRRAYPTTNQPSGSRRDLSPGKVGAAGSD
jgi:hypothetical protein